MSKGKKKNKKKRDQKIVSSDEKEGPADFHDKVSDEFLCVFGPLVVGICQVDEFVSFVLRNYIQNNKVLKRLGPA